MYKLHDLDTHHLPAPFCKTQAHAVKQQTADGPWLLECQTSTANAPNSWPSGDIPWLSWAGRTYEKWLQHPP